MTLLISQLNRFWVSRRLMRLWVKGRTVKIAAGVGRGLFFDAGVSNPDYALGLNELPVQKMFSWHIKPGDVIYDVGANVGFFTVIAAHLTGADGQVIAFEPLPENIDVLRYNVGRNGFHSNVTVIDKAVSEKIGTTQLFVAEYSGGSAIDGADRPPDTKSTLSVDTVSLDELIIEQEIPRPDFVKIDVEGAEGHVLRGMIDCLQEFRPKLLIELDSISTNGLHQKEQELTQMLHAFGYHIQRLPESYRDIGWEVSHFIALPE